MGVIPPSPYSRLAASGHRSPSSFMASETAERGESSASAELDRRSDESHRSAHVRVSSPAERHLTFSSMGLPGSSCIEDPLYTDRGPVT